jgi:hypothetical protein
VQKFFIPIPNSTFLLNCCRPTLRQPRLEFSVDPEYSRLPILYFWPMGCFSHKASNKWAVEGYPEALDGIAPVRAVNDRSLGYMAFGWEAWGQMAIPIQRVREAKTCSNPQ